jgi:phosphoribosylanthranilate isomerase
VFIKICGIRDPDTALYIASLGVSAIGLVFHPKSPRYVSISMARRVIESAAGKIAIVGVFKDNLDLQMHSKIVEYLDFIQIYEIPKNNLGKRVILGVKGKVEFDADYYLIDFSMGSNRFVELPLDLFGYRRDRVIVSGGLNEGNVLSVIERYRPFGIDVSSGVEIAPGIKDRELIRRFVETIRRIEK